MPNQLESREYQYWLPLWYLNSIEIEHNKIEVDKPNTVEILNPYYLNNLRT